MSSGVRGWLQNVGETQDLLVGLNNKTVTQYANRGTCASHPLRDTCVVHYRDLVYVAERNHWCYKPQFVLEATSRGAWIVPNFSIANKRCMEHSRFARTTSSRCASTVNFLNNLFSNTNLFINKIFVFPGGGDCGRHAAAGTERPDPRHGHGGGWLSHLSILDAPG